MQFSFGLLVTAGLSGPTGPAAAAPRRDWTKVTDLASITQRWCLNLKEGPRSPRVADGPEIPPIPPYWNKPDKPPSRHRRGRDLPEEGHESPEGLRATSKGNPKRLWHPRTSPRPNQASFQDLLAHEGHVQWLSFTRWPPSPARNLWGDGTRW